MKARLKDEKQVLEKLTQLGCVFSEVKTQDDMVWAERAATLEEFLGNSVFLRIRIQNGSKVVLTAKKSKTKSGDGSLIKREHEVVVDSAEEARGILDMLGLTEVVRVVKKRRTTKYKEYEICVDEIENLGAFIEVERISGEEDAERIQQEMTDFLLSLGVSPEDKVSKGYDILMLEKQELK